MKEKIILNLLRFLNPNLIKIIIFILLIFIYWFLVYNWFFVDFEAPKCLGDCIGNEITNNKTNYIILDKIINIFIFIAFPCIIIVLFFEELEYLFNGNLFYFIGVIYIYIISCTIYYLFKYLKNKVHNKWF